MPDLRLGRWQDVLADAEPDCIITDPPYSERCHSGQTHPRDRGCVDDGMISKEGLGYGFLTESDVREFCDRWRTTPGWIVILTDHILCPTWERHLADDGAGQDRRCVFAPLPVVMRGMNVRLAGDGPSSWCVWCVVSRPIGMKWRTLPGAYVGTPNRDRIRAGGKPMWLMQALVRDYSRPGDLVCDPYAGGATTLIAAAVEGRRGVGAEVDAETHARAQNRIMAGHTPTML